MKPRFAHILVPVDFTEKNLSALEIAKELAVVGQTRVTLLHVIETLDCEMDDEIAQFYSRLQVRADSELERLSQFLSAAGLEVDRKIRLGKRLREIVADSIERQVDLIVMSSHKPNLREPMKTWATLSYQVSNLCTCPVLLVK